VFTQKCCLKSISLSSKKNLLKTYSTIIVSRSNKTCGATYVKNCYASLKLFKACKWMKLGFITFIYNMLRVQNNFNGSLLMPLRQNTQMFESNKIMQKIRYHIFCVHSFSTASYTLFFDNLCCDS